MFALLTKDIGVHRRTGRHFTGGGGGKNLP